MKFLVALIFTVTLSLGGSFAALAQNETPSAEAQNAIININTATAVELQSLTGIGSVKARSIVAHREKEPFSSVDDLTRVEGIGSATLERIRSKITVN